MPGDRDALPADLHRELAEAASAAERETMPRNVELLLDLWVILPTRYGPEAL